MTHWIDLRDEEPRKGEFVLGYLRYYEDNPFAYVVVRYVGDQYFKDEDECMRFVTHWAQLMKPPISD